MRDGGCSRRRPWILDSEDRMRMSFWPSNKARLARVRSPYDVILTFAATHTKQPIEAVGNARNH
jgi:hypothetical protein